LNILLLLVVAVVVLISLLVDAPEAVELVDI